MSEARTLTPGRINREGTFLWQLDYPSGSGMNLWSGKLYANNGYSSEYAEKAAALFGAAPAMHKALQLAEGRLMTLDAMKHPAIPRNDDVIADIRAALKQAEGA